MHRGLTIVFLAILVGCGGSGTGNRSFDDEFQLTMRAGRGLLSDADKASLLKENHPILAQVGDPNASRLMELFSRLPEEERRRLLVDTYIKWRLSEFDGESQLVYREMIDKVVQIRFGVRSPFETVTEPQARRALLEETEIGFAVVELEQSQEKVVSWYAIGPSFQSPLWVTIVNSDATGTEEYVRAHLMRLPMLRTLRSSTAPRIFKLPQLISSLV